MLYEDTFDKLRAAEAAAERALNLALAARARARQALEDMLERAATLPDGTRVFRDEHGDVWTEHGERITGAESEAIAWPKDAPSYESYVAQAQAVAEANRRIDVLRGYQVDVLGNICERMTDEDDPPSADKLRGFQQTLDERMPDVTSTRKLDAVPDADPVATDKLDIPKL